MWRKIKGAFVFCLRNNIIVLYLSASLTWLFDTSLQEPKYTGILYTSKIELGSNRRHASQSRRANDKATYRYRNKIYSDWIGSLRTRSVPLGVALQQNSFRHEAIRQFCRINWYHSFLFLYKPLNFSIVNWMTFPFYCKANFVLIGFVFR